MLQDLSIRKSHKYVGTYQHEDKWESIGSAEEIGSKELPMSEEDEEDMCEPRANLVYLIVKADAGKTDDEIKRALHDIYTQHGCAHEWDCCGCRSYYASDMKRVTGDLWSVKVSSSRNF